MLKIQVSNRNEKARSEERAFVVPTGLLFIFESSSGAEFGRCS